ncbi:AraC family transcriptional regulator [Flavobacterium sp.]|uniref:AraC family transcriptional regulator n=1 Tax=Flavobacterium sp. TaxID=239 RepID=UPI002FD99DA5
MKIVKALSVWTFVFLTTVEVQSFSHTSKGNSKNYNSFEEKINRNKPDTAQVLETAFNWLKQAKKDKNPAQQVNAYKHIMHWVEKKYRMIYADSLIQTALTTNNNQIVGSAYLTVGAAYYNNRELVKALDHYVEANNYIVKTQDKYLINKVKYTIAQTKFHLGYYHEAIALFNESSAFFKDENETAYLNTLHALALCYNKIERFDLSSYHNQLGMQLAQEYEREELTPYFKNAEGINQYSQKNYNKAIKLLKESFPVLVTNQDYANQIVSQFYLGKCYWDLNQTTEALPYFEDVVKQIEAKNFIRPDLRENFEILISYYASQKRLNKQLEIIEKLLAYDNNLNKEFKYLSYKIHKDYDTKSLILKKQKIKVELERNKHNTYLILLGIGLLVIAGVFYFSRLKKREQKKFENILNTLKSEPKLKVKNQDNLKTTISPELSKTILSHLEKFEKQKGYLEKDMNLTKLATKLNTNTKYVSVTISQYRGKKTTTYINDLKIEYILKLLLEHSKYRNYTNQALAEEAGFGSTQIFTQCFKNKTGLSPTSFIQQLNASNQTIK